MSANAVIGALRAVLGVDTAAWDDGLKTASKQLSSFGAGVAKAGAAIGLAMGAAATAVGVAVKHTIDQADDLGKTAQKIGIPVEELSKLKHAADLSGIGMENLTVSLGKLGKNMVEAAAKPTSASADAFRALGVSVTNSDGTLKGQSQTLSEIAGKFEGLKDGAGKTAVSMAIFGKSGKDLIPLLNAGKDGLQEMKDEAVHLGIVITDKTAKSAEVFNDNLTRLGKVKDGIILKITEGMLPGLEDLSKSMVRAANDSTGLKTIGETISGMFVGVAFELEKFSLALKRLPLEWEAFKSAMSTLPFTEASKKAWSDFNAVTAESERLLSNLVITQQTANLADAFGPVAEKAPKAAAGLKDFNYQALAGKTAIDQFVASQEKAIASQQAELETVGMAAGAKERLRIIEQGLQLAVANRIPVTEELILQMRELGNQAADVALKLQGAQLIQSSLTPGEMFRTEMENNRLALVAFGATAEQIGAVQEKTAEKYNNTWAQAGESIAGSFKKIGDAFGKENKEMAMVAKVAGIIQGTISMFTGAAKALELPFPANLAAMASVLATGAGLVASIKGTDTGGFATGGSFRVPGGMGGGDSVRAMVDLEPGEQVDIWRPGQGGQDPRRAAGAQTMNLTLQGRFFDRETVRELIDSMNDLLGDSVRLNVRMA